MNVLFLGTYSPEALQNEVDYARWFEAGKSTVVRFDPEAAYLEGGIGGMESKLLAAIETHHIDLIVYALGIEFDFRPQFFRSLPHNVFSILLLGDDEHYFEMSHRYYAQGFDLVLTLNPLVERYQLYGIEAWRIPSAFNGKVYFPSAGTPKTIDVSFVGAMRGKIGRARYADALKQAGIDVRTYGVGTPGGMVTRAQAVDIYRRSRINLNFTGTSFSTPLDAHLSINRRVRQLKGRCFMLALCGSFVLSEYAPGIEMFFEIGKEIDVFRNERELIERIRFYLANDDLRESMAAAAHQRALDQYEETRVGETLMNSLRQRIDDPRRVRDVPIFIDAMFRSGFGAWRFKYLVMFLILGKLHRFAGEFLLLLKTGRCDLRAAYSFAVLGLHVAGRLSKLGAVTAGTARRIRRMFRRAGQE